MDVTTQLLQLLSQKQQQFETYKQYTQILLECDSEIMTDYITKREALANEIDAINKKINDICAAHPQQALLKEILLLHPNYSDVPAEFKPVFAAVQQIFAQINYITGLNSQIIQRAQNERDEAKAQLVEKKNTPKIVRYLTNLTPGEDDGALTISNKKA
ncbi:MAG: hypothetical protein PHG02_01455 [Oscillospiraceae bacterium]|nr:hypothetical protein [Oscillospiraceae bacterium]